MRPMCASLPRGAAPLARALVLLLATLWVMPAALISAQAADPTVGEAVAFYGPEGDEQALMTVKEVVFPFRDYDPSSPPQRGTQYALVALSIDVTGGRELQFDPNGVAIQDNQGFLSYPTFVSRPAEATAALPDLSYGALAPGTVTTGAVIVPVVAGAELIRVVYLPQRDRLVVLADLRQEPTAGGDEPAATEPAATEPAATETAGTEAPATYENAVFGFALAYDPAGWEVSESPTGITFTGEAADGTPSVLSIDASRSLLTEASACVEDVANQLALTSSRQDFAPLADDAGTPIAVGDAAMATAFYLFISRGGTEMFERVECRTLPADRGALLIRHTGPLAAVQAETNKAEAILAGLTFAE